MKIEDKVMLVTGANRGIGRALVEALAKAGAKKIYATTRDESAFAALSAIDPMKVVPLRLDVTKPAEVAEVAKRAEDVDVLVNNAGLLASFNVLTSSRADLERDFQTNFYGVLDLTRAALPALTRSAKAGRQPALVNVLSVVSLASMVGLGGYSASKAAAMSLTQSLRAELGKQGIDVHAVFPGPVDTDMTKGIEMPKSTPASVAAAIVAGLQRGDIDISPDPMSTDVLAAWKASPKAVEQMFASM